MKKWYQSKTFYVNLIIALSPIVPGASEYFTSHPEVFVIAFSVINIALRLISKDAIQILPD